MTPDWAARPTAVPYAVFGDPQSLNLYSYVRNNPVARADADGHCEAVCWTIVGGLVVGGIIVKEVSDLSEENTPRRRAWDGIVKELL